MMHEALIIFLKNAVKGKVKTRLAASIGEEKTLKIYEILLNRTTEITERFQVDKLLFYSDYIERNDSFNNDVYKKYVQCSGDLGKRMDYAFSIAFKRGYKNAVIIGTDCYELTREIIEEAFHQLDIHDYVIGPAADGGYYLLGMKHTEKTLFENKSWGGDTVFEDTRRQILAAGKTLFLLPTLTDLDDVDDLHTLPPEIFTHET